MVLLIIKKVISNYMVFYWGNRYDLVSFLSVIYFLPPPSYDSRYFTPQKDRFGWLPFISTPIIRINCKCSNIYIYECSIIVKKSSKEAGTYAVFNKKGTINSRNYTQKQLIKVFSRRNYFRTQQRIRPTFSNIDEHSYFDTNQVM